MEAAKQTEAQEQARLTRLEGRRCRRGVPIPHFAGVAPYRQQHVVADAERSNRLIVSAAAPVHGARHIVARLCWSWLRKNKRLAEQVGALATHGTQLEEQKGRRCATSGGNTPNGRGSWVGVLRKATATVGSLVLSRSKASTLLAEEEADACSLQFLLDAMQIPSHPLSAQATP